MEDYQTQPKDYEQDSCDYWGRRGAICSSERLIVRVFNKILNIQRAHQTIKTHLKDLEDERT